MPRIACLFVPLFPLAARLRAEPELIGEAVAVCEGNGSAARVVAASRPARRLALRIGMTLAQARSILPDLIARGRDSACERSAHEALLDTAWSLSPRVEQATEDMVFADISGTRRLFPDEQEAAQFAVAAAASLDLLIRVAIAANKLAARIATLQPGPPTVVPAGEEAAFLAPLPLHHLGLEPRLAATLQRWGVTTVGELAGLPADRVASRLGPAGSQALAAAGGEDPRPLIPHQPPSTVNEGMALEWPVVTVEPLLYAVRQALERTHSRLEQLSLACTLLELDLDLEPEGADRRTIRLPAPTRDVEALLAIVRLELEARPPRSPVTGFTCLVHPDRPRQGQLTLFGPPDIDPDKLAITLGRLAARLGPDRIGSPRTVDGHLPERLACAPYDPPPPPNVRRPPRQGRGLLVVRVLRPPVELEVITEEILNSELRILNSPPSPAKTQADDPTPLPSTAYDIPTTSGQVAESSQPENSKFKIQNSTLTTQHSKLNTQNSCLRLLSLASAQGATPRIQGLVRVAAGPWQLEEGWWSDHPTAREYWDVELSGGGLYRIYRDRTTENWYADGMYD